MPSKSQRKLTQDERSAISDQRLIDAAIELIVEVGTAGTTLKALGDVSGYSRGHVTYRFGTKAGLFKAVIKQVSERWSRSLEARVEGLTGAPALLACSDAYFELNNKDWKVWEETIQFYLGDEKYERAFNAQHEKRKIDALICQVQIYDILGKSDEALLSVKRIQEVFLIDYGIENGCEVDIWKEKEEILMQSIERKEQLSIASS